MWTGLACRTLAATMGAYDPLRYHNGSGGPHDKAICAAGGARYGRWDVIDRIADQAYGEHEAGYRPGWGCLLG